MARPNVSTRPKVWPPLPPSQPPTGPQQEHPDVPPTPPPGVDPGDYHPRPAQPRFPHHEWLRPWHPLKPEPWQPVRPLPYFPGNHLPGCPMPMPMPMPDWRLYRGADDMRAELAGGRSSATAGAAQLA
jgi:hypothetical protein